MENPAVVIDALTHEIPNYVARLSDVIGSSQSELWMLALAASGRMLFPDAPTKDALDDLRARVPDTVLPDGRTRYSVWRAALIEVINLLGDPEARYRTGFDSAELHEGVSRFFDV